MEHEQGPGPTPEKIPYDAEAFGLDLHDQSDLDVYVNSEGDALLAGHLLARREVYREHMESKISDEQYQHFLDDLDVRIAIRRREIGLPTA